MPPIKDLQTIASKWAVVAGRSGDAYQEGIEAPRRSWKAGAQAANANYKASMQAALSRDAFKAGVDRSSDENWKRGAIDKGVTRYSAGVLLSADKYQAGFRPYAEVIKNTMLPDRKPKGDPTNINRVSIMAKALHDAKLKIMGARA